MKPKSLQRISVILALLAAPLLCAQNPGGTPRPRAEPLKGESRLIPRGDVELLTYETEADVQKLEELLTANAAAAPQPGEFTMNYFRSGLDGSVQPYGFWLPRDHAPGKKFALLVQLHGIGSKSLAGRRTAWRGMGVKEWIDPYAPVIVAQPMGRGNTFYHGMGEADVLEVIADVSRRHAVDPDRVFIMGHSMGGAGSWLVGLHYPDRFGSITPVDAAMGFRDAVDDPQALPAWMLPQVALFKPEKLFPNARNVPVFLKNAGAGIQKASTRFSDGVVAEGGFATMESFPGMPHHFAPQISYSIFAGAATVRPIVRQPAEVKFFTTTLRHNQAYWVTLDRLTQHNAEARVTATHDDGQPKPIQGGRGQPRPAPEPARPPSLKVTTQNIDALTLRLRDAGVPADKPLALVVDGTTVSSGAVAEIVHLAKTDGQWRTVAAPALGGKRHGRQGPIGDSFNAKFLAVYGEGDLPLARAELDAIRNPPSQLVIQAEFPLKAAARVTTEEIANSNLILFGTPKTNPLLARLAPKLPTALLTAADTGSAVIFVYPNPENPARTIVVWTGRVLSTSLEPRIEAGWMQPLNLLPDYVTVKDGKITKAGHFDRDWR
ncbi:MAG: alpha/beta fold hydrolase [Opitutaceae bacterium]|nr:alpha/beta fold hydrolase [Opitutaceae bacterium]